MATISSYFGAAGGRRPDSDRVILAPTYISPRPNDLDGILIEPDEFKLNGKQYVRYVVVAKSQKHTKKRTSVVWQYGEDIQLKQDLTKRFWYCYLCEQQQRQQGLPISGKGNCTALDHLESKHQIDRETGERRHAKRHPSQPSIVDFNNISTLVFKRRFDEFKELLIRWIVYCHIAFFQIENLYFRELLFYIFPGLTTLLPKAILVVRRWIIEAFEARKDSLRQEMQTAHSNISISFDIWTSPNYQAILVCVAHFINRSGKRRTVVLALRELVGEHSGENMADVLLHIFDDYGISGRIGYFMADNASSNDACIDLVLKALYPNMSRKHRVRRRLRCFGHIVNLCAQAFIMGKDAAKTCKDLDSAYREGDYSRIRELWKKRGAIGRLHNIVRYIRASPQRRQFFRSIQIGGDLAAFDGLELAQSQSTRWNSYFLSIGRALNVKERIQLFCDQYEPPQSDRDVLDQRLSPRQWDELGHLHDQLETFYEATVMNEGRQRPAAAEVAWQKCEKYYNKADESPAYYAAISLNPSLKNQWYYQVWNGSDDKRAWIQAAVGAVKELWVDEYKGKFAHGAPVPTHVFKSPEPKEKSFTSVRNHKRLKLRHTDPHSSPELPSTDHYNEFITTDVIGLNDDEEFDPIQYWNERYHSQTDLARMALDVLALPPMSDECERLFSSAKLLLTDHRSRLRMDVIEASECLRAWYGRPKQKAFEDSAIGLMEGEAGSTVGADGPETVGRTGDEDVKQLLKSLSLYGFRQPMSRESSLSARRKIKSDIIRDGIPAIWFTLNPIDITNPVKLRLAAYRARDPDEAEAFLMIFDLAYKRTGLAISDPLSSATFFHREVSMFFKHYVKAGKESVFGRISRYFGVVETSERGALHVHGHLWLQGNMHLSSILRDVEEEDQAAYREGIIQYVDSVFAEDLDQEASSTVQAERSVTSDISSLLENSQQFAAAFDEEANFCAGATQIHTHRTVPHHR
ncbi:hypothetical protein FPOA_13469 [Fusarium poae]|uniref:HAT C-terminal dimerisation domain-containing protein n=1 Tax=Fusarium poae TaxID=36050 RepID=A0A1B8A5I9_FUSPO|nr:hypothetical protein FPOA_13469 [Fusarium poae]